MQLSPNDSKRSVIEVGDDPLLNAAQRVADCFSQYGYAFIEDDKLNVLASALQGFLSTARIPTNTSEV